MPSGSHSPDDDQPTIPPSAGGIPDQDATQAPTSSATDIGPRDLPQLEDYELLEELGRGGMGVVYKARQKKLDRTVALKMILGGQFASEEAVRRFELEAETAARLDHPGIVPIYEIGQSGGNHFFSMKLIEGKSLDQEQDQYKNDPRKSVELMIEIAHAVQHAHERGVLHRDLKPANILIDNDGNAAVTDLGLAKVLDDDSGLTQTGLVMGSPGFMSPEQAAGKSDVTTAVDVYSLGAVLYWLIAGRPPFQAETRLEVILQTIDSTPESVRVYRPDADRDLNLICQKALQKSPKDRYVSASEFATDLQAWLDGDPLSVKPPTTIDLARNWIRKNFRTVAMALASGILCGLTVGLIILLVQVSNLIDFTADQYAMLGETETPWVLRYFYWVKSIPNWILVIMPPAMVWMNVVFGIATIRLIKPKSREVGLVAATAAALLSGIVAFMLSFGWAPITTQAISAGQDDIELLSAAMWMAEGSERKLAQRALVQRYPGLKDLNTRKKVYLVRRKIMSDQSFAVPKAMWIGILTTMCLTVFPLFFTTMFSGLLWDKGDRGWAYFGKSIELGTYSTLFFLVTTKFVTNSVGISPGFVFQVVALAGLGLALYWAVSDKKVAWRIAGFLLANFCIMSNFAESGNIDKAWQFAQNAITEKELRTAARYYDKRLVRNDTPWVRYQVGILAAYRNDDAKHAEMCHQLLSNFKNVHRPDVAEQIVKLSLLKPGSLTDSELATVHELAEIVSGYGPSFDQKWLFFAKAMSEMRQGNLAETLDWNSRCRDVVNSNTAVSQPYLVASTYVVDALAYQQTGDLSKVDQSLDNARQTIETVTDSTKFSWLQRMVFEVLLEEVSGSRTFKRTASD